jgi:hypothetical protein
MRTLTLAGWLMVAVGVLCVLSLGYCAYDGNRDRRAAERLASANAETFGVTVAARDDLSAQTASDTKANSTLERDLTNAVSPLPDARPSDRRIALQCERLRKSGTDVTRLPACVGAGR